MTATNRNLIILLICAVFVTGCAPAAKTVKTGRLLVISEPSPGAEIFVNGKNQPYKTNAFFNLKPGRYEIKLVKPVGDTTGEPEIGEAVTEIRAGRFERLTISLNKMKLIPAADSGPMRPESQAQKVIVDFFAAVNARDAQAAFAHLSREAKWAYGGQAKFTRALKTITSAKLVSLQPVSYDPTTSVEINKVKFETTHDPKIKWPAPLFGETVEATVTTIDELKVGLAKIRSIQ